MSEKKKIGELPACPVETTLMLIGDKWKVLILRDLMPGTKRFGELKKSIGSVSQKVLTAQLRDMEEKGLVNRKVYAEGPTRVGVAACGHALLQAKSHFKLNPPNFAVYPESVVATRMAELEAARRREELVNKGSAFIRLLWEIHQKKSTQSPGRAAESLDPDVRERLRPTIMKRIADPET